MEVKDYTVEKSGRIQGIWHDKGETIPLDDVAARYPVLSGQIKPAKKTSKNGEGK